MSRALCCNLVGNNVAKHALQFLTSPPHLHLPSQVLVLVPDDRQGGLLTQGVRSVPERLLWGRRRGRTSNLLLAQTVAPFVGP